MSTPPQYTELPRLVEPRRLARQGRSLQGMVSADRCDRLPEIVERLQPLRADLVFIEDDQGRCCIQGEVSAEVSLICQRCMEPVELEVCANPDVLVVRSHDQVHGKEAEYLVVEEESADVIAFLEDEIILGLPLVAMHPEGVCQAPLSEAQDQQPCDDKEKRDNPFKILESLKETPQ